ncbi:MAG: DNA-directed RNA polymerase subunit D [Candidatus Nanohaloarchaeota archaeon QJJ-9]|nr:DNA-directed RNA polymerase subunit D [Candidatus Nanohaloarchaeota archaeon QJJ-9]
MEIDKIEENGKNLKFVLSGANPAIANTLRRTIMGKVPTLAVEEVDLINNTSGLFDEMVAHRIGMIPWEFPQKEYKLPDDCDCEGEKCQDCQVEMVLEKQGEGKVRAKDLKPTDKKVETPNPEIVITELLEGQELELEARARLGIGKDHAKFQAANASYKYYPIVKLNGEKVENKEDAARVAPDKVKKADGELEADDSVVKAMGKTVDISEGDTVEMEQREDKFIFTVESVSGLEPDYIVEKALDIIKEELGKFKEDAEEAIQNA